MRGNTVEISRLGVFASLVEPAERRPDLKAGVVFVDDPVARALRRPRVDAEGHDPEVFNHLILAGSMPELLTADPARPFRISGDTLVLGDEETWRRICERVG